MILRHKAEHPKHGDSKEKHSKFKGKSNPEAYIQSAATGQLHTEKSDIINR